MMAQAPESGLVEELDVLYTTLIYMCSCLHLGCLDGC